MTERARRGAGRLTPPTPRYADRDDAWALAAELLTATFVWGGVGWLVDRWLGTGPVVMVLGFVLGNALGVYLIWLRSQDRFTQQHAELLARRDRTRRPADPVTSVPLRDAGPGGTAPSVPDVTPASPSVVAASSTVDAPDPVDLDDDTPVAPLYPGQRRD